jgi:transcriptional regulator with XRE-family HTH domain
MRTFRRLTQPQKAHPLVRRLFDEMNDQKIGILDMAERSGVNKNTLNDWRTRTVPTVDNLEACMAVLGYELTFKSRGAM